MRVNDQILSLAGEETLHVAKALGMAAAYYHGFDAESASEVSLVAKNIGESLMAKIPSCVALRMPHRCLLPHSPRANTCKAPSFTSFSCSSSAAVLSNAEWNSVTGFPLLKSR